MFSYLDFSEFLFADNFVLGRTKIPQARVAFIKFIINRFDAFPITPQIRIVNACKITCSKACSKVSANSSNDASTDIIHHRLKQVSNIKSGLSADIVGSRDTRANIVGRQTKKALQCNAFSSKILRLSAAATHELTLSADNVGWQKWQPTLSADNVGSCVAGWVPTAVSK